MLISSPVARDFLGLNISRVELNDLSKLDVKVIRQTTFNRLQKTLVSTNNHTKQIQMLDILNKKGQYNEHGVHILDKYSKDKIIFIDKV